MNYQGLIKGSGGRLTRNEMMTRWILLCLGVWCNLFIASLPCFAGDGIGKESLNRLIAQVPKALTKPQVDGKIDDVVEWQDAVTLELRMNNGQNIGKLPASPTIVKLKWDENNLYAAFICYDQDIKGLLKDRDAKLWESAPEIAELILCPDGNLADYVEFCFNPGGALSDIRLTWPDTKRDFPDVNEWNAKEIKWAVSVKGTPDVSTDTDEYWIVEFALGWKSFHDINPKIGMKMFANLYRANSSADAYAAWSPTDKHFQVPQKFGVLILGKPNDPQTTTP